VVDLLAGLGLARGLADSLVLAGALVLAGRIVGRGLIAGLDVVGVAGQRGARGLAVGTRGLAGLVRGVVLGVVGPRRVAGGGCSSGCRACAAERCGEEQRHGDRGGGEQQEQRRADGSGHAVPPVGGV